MSALDNLDVLEYRVTQLEKLLEPLMKLVNDLEKKLALLAQKMVIATMLIGVIVNGVGVWYGANAAKNDTAVGSGVVQQSDSDKIKALQAELDKLKHATTGSK
jgi:hypothetical protein